VRNAQKIERVVLNIVGNAVKFTSANGTITISLKPHPDNTQVWALRVWRHGHWHSGPKCCPRFHSDTSGSAIMLSGTGLGPGHFCARNRRVARRFHEVLPVRCPGPTVATAVYVGLAAGSHADGGRLFAGPPKRRPSVKARIAEIGYDVSWAESARSALAFCFEKQPAVFVLDARIPDMDVRDVIRNCVRTTRPNSCLSSSWGRDGWKRAEVEFYQQFGVFYVTFALARRRSCHPPWRFAVLGKLH
jgi:hypothetical protein